eukprot:g3830.t1
MLYAINTAEGTKKWEFLTGGSVCEFSVHRLRDGQVFYGRDGANGRGGTQQKAGASSASDCTDCGVGLVHKTWDFQTGGYVYSSPTISSDGATAFVRSNDNKLYAINTVDGTKKWEFLAAGSSVQSSPTLSSDGATVFAGSSDKKLYAINTVDGTKKWEFLTGSYVQSSPTLSSDGATVFVGSITKGSDCSPCPAGRAGIKQLQEEETKKLLGMLYMTYKPDLYWFESVTMLFKLALWATLVFFEHGSQFQLAMSAAICWLQLGVHARFEPFEDGFKNMLQYASYTLIAFTSFSGLVLNYINVSLELAALAQRKREQDRLASEKYIFSLVAEIIIWSTTIYIVIKVLYYAFKFWKKHGSTVMSLAGPAAGGRSRTDEILSFKGKRIDRASGEGMAPQDAMDHLLKLAEQSQVFYAERKSSGHRAAAGRPSAVEGDLGVAGAGYGSPTMPSGRASAGKVPRYTPEDRKMMRELDERLQGLLLELDIKSAAAARRTKGLDEDGYIVFEALQKVGEIRERTLDDVDTIMMVNEEGEVAEMYVAEDPGMAMKADGQKTLNYRQAITRNPNPEDKMKFQAARDKEWGGTLIGKKVLTSVKRKDLPKGITPLPLGWVFVKKIDPLTGMVDKYKGRCYAVGSVSKAEIHYDADQRHAGTTSFEAAKILIVSSAMAATYVTKVDISSAFTLATASRTIYYYSPEGVSRFDADGDAQLWKGLANLYGNVDAAFRWLQLGCETITQGLGMRRCIWDGCAFRQTLSREDADRIMALGMPGKQAADQKVPLGEPDQPGEHDAGRVVTLEKPEPYGHNESKSEATKGVAAYLMEMNSMFKLDKSKDAGAVAKSSDSFELDFATESEVTHITSEYDTDLKTTVLADAKIAEVGSACVPVVNKPSQLAKSGETIPGNRRLGKLIKDAAVFRKDAPRTLEHERLHLGEQVPDAKPMDMTELPETLAPNNTPGLVWAVCVVWVDDMLLLSNCPRWGRYIKRRFLNRFKGTEEENPSTFLGLGIEKTKDGRVKITQSVLTKKYIDAVQALDNGKEPESRRPMKSASTPITEPSNPKLKGETPEEIKRGEKLQMPRLAGILSFLRHTRPDL